MYYKLIGYKRFHNSTAEKQIHGVELLHWWYRHKSFQVLRVSFHMNQAEKKGLDLMEMREIPWSEFILVSFDPNAVNLDNNNSLLTLLHREKYHSRNNANKCFDNILHALRMSLQ